MGLRQDAGQRRARFLAAVFVVGGDEHHVLARARPLATGVGDLGRKQRRGGDGKQGEQVWEFHQDATQGTAPPDGKPKATDHPSFRIARLRPAAHNPAAFHTR